MKGFVLKIQQQFALMCSANRLFRASVTGDELYEKYIASFPDGSNPIFRDPASSYHNCNNCKNFIRRYGNIVAIGDDGNLVTMFGFVQQNKTTDAYGVVAHELDAFIKSRSIEGVFVETYDVLNKTLNYERCTPDQKVFRLGIDTNHKTYTKEEADKYGVVSPGETREFTHIHLDIPAKFIDKSGKSVEAIVGDYLINRYQVFKRSMEEISMDTLNLVEDLINQGSLLNGDTHMHAIKDAIRYKDEYDNLPANLRDNWMWKTICSVDERTAKFGGTVIGALCYELTEGKELNHACQSFNKRVDSVNYMKATAPISKKQIEEARKFVDENGYTASFTRRLANIDDIKVAEIMHVSTNSDLPSGVSFFDNVKPTSTQHKRARYDDVEEVPIDKFMEDILPKCTSVEALLLNKHEGNMVTLTTTTSNKSKPIFKWNNNFSWTFNGNLAGKSEIKEAVKSRGGKVDGVLRFSIAWADDGGKDGKYDNSDLDAHALEPNGTHIYFSSGYRKDKQNGKTTMTGQLDVDIINPSSQDYKDVVENIAWTDIKKMKDGVYKLWVHQYSARNSKGFRAEIEFDGNVFEYVYDRPVSGEVHVAEVTLKDGVFSIRHVLPSTASGKTIWGLETNEFYKVNLICLSPNHWDGSSVGNKHYMFMLDGCKVDTDVRGFHNENLITELLQHRKVMEVLGATNMIKTSPNDKQLSGLGFNSTVRDEVVLRLAGSFKRMIKVKF